MKQYKMANSAEPEQVPHGGLRNTLGGGLTGEGAEVKFLPFLPPLPFPRPPNGPLPGPLSNPFALPGQYTEKPVYNGVKGSKVFGREYVDGLGALIVNPNEPTEQPW